MKIAHSKCFCLPILTQLSLSNTIYQGHSQAVLSLWQHEREGKEKEGVRNPPLVCCLETFKKSFWGNYMSQDRSKLVFHSPSLTNWFTRFVLVHLLLFLISQIDWLFLIQEPRFQLNQIREVKTQLPTEKGRKTARSTKYTQSPPCTKTSSEYIGCDKSCSWQMGQWMSKWVDLKIE